MKNRNSVGFSIDLPSVNGYFQELANSRIKRQWIKSYFWFAKTLLVLSDSNVIRTYNHLVRKRTLNQTGQTGQLIGLCCEYLSVRCIWLYVIIMSHRRFRVNPYSIVCLNVKELLFWSRSYIWSLSDFW